MGTSGWLKVNLSWKEEWSCALVKNGTPCVIVEECNQGESQVWRVHNWAIPDKVRMFLTCQVLPKVIGRAYTHARLPTTSLTL